MNLCMYDQFKGTQCPEPVIKFVAFTSKYDADFYSCMCLCESHFLGLMNVTIFMNVTEISEEEYRVYKIINS
jgi:hypothetical protein